MILENLRVARICLHEVYRRSDERTVRPPAYANELLRLPERALAAFVSRVLAAFKSDAQCMEMAIRRFDAASLVAKGAALRILGDADFLNQSRIFADMLADAQVSRQIPGGLVVVFDGHVGYPERKFFAVMKAELHDGFLKQGNLQATFVDTLFLSPKTKLYKIGIFVAQSDAPNLPDGWLATVYDNQMTAVNREGAALYFHDTYLGLSIPENTAQQTRKFFITTKDFIKNSTVSEDIKVDLYNSLYTYLKVDRSPTIQTGEFANSYLPEALQDGYREYMRRERVPERAIKKDLTEVAGSLRVRRLRFPQKIILSGPPEAISQLVDIEPIEGEDGARWTHITVRGALEGQT